MKGKLPSQEQRNIFRPILIEIINPNHKLVLLSAKMEWKLFENEFGQLYSNTGKPGVPIRIMVGLLILKIIYNLGDVAVMEQWIQNPYFQYFCGESEFQWKFPCDPSDLVYFRKRIGTQGAELIYKMTADLHEFRLSDSMADTSEPLNRNSYFEDNKILGRIIKLFKKIAK